jgi:hypothetical protein
VYVCYISVVNSAPFSYRFTLSSSSATGQLFCHHRPLFKDLWTYSFLRCLRQGRPLLAPPSPLRRGSRAVAGIFQVSNHGVLRLTITVTLVPGHRTIHLLPLDRPKRHYPMANNSSSSSTNSWRLWTNLLPTTRGLQLGRVRTTGPCSN